MNTLKMIIILSVIASYGYPATNAEETCSSRTKCFGVGGWHEGKDCQGIELSWKADENNPDDSNVFFQRKDGKSFLVGKNGMALFSPDCQFFWFTEYYFPVIFQVYRTETGDILAQIAGLYPAWSLDATEIYFSRKREQYQLWKWSVSQQDEMLVCEVEDYQRGVAPYGDGIDWLPVTFTEHGMIQWLYPTTAIPPKEKQFSRQPAKIVTILPPMNRIINQEWTEISYE